jgi:hypothetical protein
MKAKSPQQWPEKYDCTNQERAMKKILEIEFCEKRREMPGAPEKGRGKQRASDYDCEKISEQFGGIFQGR